ncbi:Odorant receptor Or73 [Rhyzopertha dominica]|nr:Odorant receptor Or73 [Rhyzopertha dominica]
MVPFEYKPMVENYLHSIKRTCMVYYEYPSIRIVSIFFILIVSVYNVILTLMAIIYGWNMDWLFVVAILVTNLHGIDVLYLIDGLYGDIVTLDEEMSKSFWSIQAARTELLVHFEKIFNVLKVFERLIRIAIPIVGCTVALMRFLPEWPIDITLLLTYEILSVAGLCSGSVVTFEFNIIFFYYCIHAYVQTNLLGQYFSNIDNGMDHMKFDNCNRIIRKRLICGIKQHKKLKGFAYKLKQVYSGKRLLLPISIIMIGMPVWVIWILTEGTFVVVIAIAVFICYAVAFGISGEMFTFGYEDCVQKLYECNWYKWNEENKKLLLLFVTLASKVQVIEIVRPFALRIPSLVSYLKAIYSTVTLLKSVYTSSN